MDKITEFWSYLSKARNDDDFMDSLYFKTTPQILIFFALIIFAKEYGGTPISCWAPADWQNDWVQYANDYCFVEGTYYLRLEEDLDAMSNTAKHDTSIKYYPWLHFLFAFQAVVFYLPYFLWTSFNTRSGLNVRALISMANQAAFSKTGLTSKQRLNISEHLYTSLNMARFKRRSTTREGNSNKSSSDRVEKPERNPFVRLYRRYIGRYILVILYFTMKVTYLMLTYYQLKLIASFLGRTSNILNIRDIIQMFTDSKSWIKTGKFPRIGICDLEVRDMESTQKHSIQCLLMANMINEKIFMAAWLWYWILMALGVINIVTWSLALFFPGRGLNFITNAILSGNGSNYEECCEAIEKHTKELKKKTDDAAKIVKTTNEQLGSVGYLPNNKLETKQIKLGVAALNEINKISTQFVPFKCQPEVYEKFVDFIGLDGILLFRLMRLNSSAPVVHEILSQLFFEYVNRRFSEEEKNTENYLNLIHQLSPSFAELIPIKH